LSLINKSSNPNTLSIKDKLKFLFKDSLFFGGLRAISILFPILMVPILTRYFSVENYGLYDSLIVLGSFISSFLVFGQDSAVARWFYQVNDFKEKQKIVSESLLIQLTFTILIIPTLLIYREELADFYLQKSSYGLHVLLILVYSVLLLINNFSINILKWTYDRIPYAIVSILKPSLILLSLFIVIICSGDMIDFLIYINIAQLITISISLFFCRKWIVIPKKLVYLKKLLYFGLPLGILASTATFLPAIQRNMISIFLDLYSVGIYAIAYKIAAFVIIIDGIFQMAWGPFSMSIFKQKDAEFVYNAVLKIFFIITIFVVFIITLFAPTLIKLFGTNEYMEATVLVLPLCLALMINGVTGITGTGIGLSLKSYLNLIPFAISAFLLTGLLYYLIPIYKLEGVVYSLLIVNSVKMIITSYIARKVYKEIRIKFELIFIFYILFAILYYCFFMINLGVVMNLILVILTFTLIIFLFLNKLERLYIFKILSQKKYK
tara:strand:+ start:1854 stop:3332 length:1479 start_codon:yes stop_codon:yes gene_type:complete